MTKPGSADVEFAGVLEPDEARRAALDRPGSAYHGVRWLTHAAEILDDLTIAAVASDGRNDESLEHTASIVRAGKHVWYDKPAGDDWVGWYGANFRLTEVWLREWNGSGCHDLGQHY